MNEPNSSLCRPMSLGASEITSLTVRTGKCGAQVDKCDGKIEFDSSSLGVVYRCYSDTVNPPGL